MYRFAWICAAITGMTFADVRTAAAAVETTVTVDAKDSIYLAGPVAFGTLNPLPGWFAGVFPESTLNLWHDAYIHSTFPAAVDISGFGPVLNISAVGTWNSNFAGGASGPDGNGILQTTHPAYTIFGVSALQADLNTLIGVFTTNAGPIPLSPPAGLSVLTDDMTNPALNQAFAIGALLDGITVPVGATQLWLGLHTRREWNDATGSMEVTIQGVPEPSSMLIWGALGAGLMWHRRKRQGNAPAAV